MTGRTDAPNPVPNPAAGTAVRGAAAGGRTLAQKIWDAHAVATTAADSDLIYIDLHLIHEVSSPQAFDGLRQARRPVRRPELTLAVEDHNVPTDTHEIADPQALAQVTKLRENCDSHGIELYRLGDSRQGIVHVTAPEHGYVQPGMTVVCGDSHTSTLGAFGALAFGIGTSEVEHVLATQTLPFARPRTIAVEFTGAPPAEVTPKDLALALLATIGANGAQGHTIEYRGRAVELMSMEGRMTLCNMSIEAGARAGLIAPDEITVAYVKNTPRAPRGSALDRAVAYWETLRSDPDATYDRVVTIDTTALKPYVTWGTNPGQAITIDQAVPDPDSLSTPAQRTAAHRALTYMGLEPGTPINAIEIDTVFVGSCTNGRIEDLKAAAEILRGRTVAPGVRMLVVPGSMQVRHQAESLGLHHVFTKAGAQWRLPGCSMCPGMNPDHITAPHRALSTTNRNYEGRQGPGARTHLASPAIAAATAVTGRITDPCRLPPPREA
jgi:3-isopropylmalate/(R)-2-methylmalate dehydratase large subunit